MKNLAVKSVPRACAQPQVGRRAFLLALCLALFVGPGRVRAETLSFQPSASPGTHLLHATAPPNSLVTLQIRDDLTTDSWADYSAPVVVGASGHISFPVPDLSYYFNLQAPPQSYFRTKIEPLELGFEDDGTNVVLKTTGEVSRDMLLYALGQAAGTHIYPMDSGDPPQPIGPFDLSSTNLQDLLDRAGIDAWVLPPPLDDPAAVDRLVINTNNQTDPLPRDPEETGTGRNEDGFPGISGLPDAPPAPIDPPPSSSGENPLTPSAGPAPDGELQELDAAFVPEGRHLRLTLNVRAEGAVEIISARELPGDAMKKIAPSKLSGGSIVYVFKSPLAATNPGSIYSVADRPNPFEVRSFEPPGVAEELTINDTATLRFPVPILENDPDLSGLKVEIYRVLEATGPNPLTPTEFTRNAGNFTLLGDLSGDEINRRLLPPTAAPDGTGGGLPGPTLTQVHRSGTRAEKYNLVIIGDGFSSRISDQDDFNEYVDKTVMKDLMERNVHAEILNAMNIFRINTFSTTSGVTQVDTNGVVIGTDLFSALGTRYSGIWSRCWMESGISDSGLQSPQAIQGILDSIFPEADGVAVIQNQIGRGGCSGSAYFTTTKGRTVAHDNWPTLAHEFGHFMGDIGDEYTCNSSNPCAVYAGAEPSRANQTANLSRNTVKWAEWIPVTRPLPTAATNIVDDSLDVGIFSGLSFNGLRYSDGIYRPSNDGGMQTDGKLHNPVGYNRIRERARAYQVPDLRHHIIGDFNGDGFKDVVMHDGVQLALHLAGDRDLGPDDPVTGQPTRGAGPALNLTWIESKRFNNPARTVFWRNAPHDIHVVADFDNDGMDDLYVINLQDWAHRYVCMLRSTGTNFVPVNLYKNQLPGYGTLAAQDQFFASDFNGDGRQDLLIYTATSWGLPYLGMMRSTGTGLALTRRYDGALPNWQMGKWERIQISDFNGDGRDDLFLWTGSDWNKVHLRIYTSTGAGYALADRHYGAITLPGFTFTLRDLDTWHVMDHNGDGRSDLGLFNGLNWNTEYFVMFTNTVSGALAKHRTYVDSFPGWNMKSRDQFTVADADGNGQDDLVVLNTRNWNAKYLGLIKSQSNDLVGVSVQGTGIGSWTFRQHDQIEAADFGGQAGWEDLFVFNDFQFGLLRSQRSTFRLQTHYLYWIHNERFHKFGYW